jgi:hypothetical protein
MTTQQKMEEELNILKEAFRRRAPSSDEAILSCTLGLLHGFLTDVKRIADALDEIGAPIGGKLGSYPPPSNLRRIADALERPRHVGGPL